MYHSTSIIVIEKFVIRGICVESFTNFTYSKLETMVYISVSQQANHFQSMQYSSRKEYTYTSPGIKKFILCLRAQVSSNVYTNKIGFKALPVVMKTL